MEIEQHCEIERKYDVDPGSPVPDLTGLPGVSRMAAPVELDQVATYFDTPDLRLLSAGVTLRRRTGGTDDGWHLKLPRGDDRREEVRVGLTEEVGEVPEALLARVRVVVRDSAVTPSAVLTTHRVVHRLVDDRGGVLAELCDDHVRAQTSSAAPTVEEWHEWEFELVDGPGDLLERAESVLVAAGARRSPVTSKVSRVLAETLPARPAWRERVDLGGEASAGDLFSGYLREHLERLEQMDQLLRSGDPEGVHQMRVAARRIRSALATCAPLLRPGTTADLRDELKWLGGVLGEARDAHVIQIRLSTLLRQQPAELVLGPVQARIDDELTRKSRNGRAEADKALDGERYFRLLDRLESFLDAPPLTEPARGRAREVVPTLLQADLNRVYQRHAAVEKTKSLQKRALALHEVRKAAKRLRYAAEGTRPVFGARATRLATRAEAIQELLGEHQDTIVARQTLREIGVRAHLDGENGFTFGRLHALEESRAGQLELEYPSTLARLPRRDLRGWLRR